MPIGVNISAMLDGGRNGHASYRKNFQNPAEIYIWCRIDYPHPEFRIDPESEHEVRCHLRVAT